MNKLDEIEQDTVYRAILISNEVLVSVARRLESWNVFDYVVTLKIILCGAIWG